MALTRHQPNSEAFPGKELNPKPRSVEVEIPDRRRVLIKVPKDTRKMTAKTVAVVVMMDGDTQRLPWRMSEMGKANSMMEVACAQNDLVKRKRVNGWDGGGGRS